MLNRLLGGKGGIMEIVLTIIAIGYALIFLYIGWSLQGVWDIIKKHGLDK